MKILNKQKILIPKNNIDMSKWACIACDQFTTSHEYWEQLDNLVASSPSTLRLILPEIYLNNDVPKLINNINLSMKKYIDDRIFREVNKAILIERMLPNNNKRNGIIMSIDLEQYSYTKELSYIKSTEETILDRLPPRIKIRENAHIELPHILLLYEDKDNTILSNIKKGKELYNFTLNMNGGSIKACKIKNTRLLNTNLNNLLDSKIQISKYGKDYKILFAVGDGNHSLATAKTIWENLKKNLTIKQQKNHPARYSLVEIINIYDEGMDFLPIHRVIYNCDIEDLKLYLTKCLGNKLNLTIKDSILELDIRTDIFSAIRDIQNYLEEYTNLYKGSIEYIHGNDELLEAVKQTKGFGIKFNKFDKSQLFKYILTNGNLPKKAFSIGEARHKRYYLEAKRIK